MSLILQPGEWIRGAAVQLRLVEPTDCTERYAGWLRDPEVNRYLETRWHEQTIETLRDFLRIILEQGNAYLFAIVVRETGFHVGNVKIGPIDPHHLVADVSYFIGDRAAWGKGYGTEAVRLATRFAFDRLDLHRVQAGFYETNVGSQRVLQKAGFTYEGRLQKKLRQHSGAAWEDHVWFGALKEKWVRGE
jgi:ribosomal-protein-alanine N-acetyltransferase